MIVHTCIWGNPTWCLVLCRDLKKALTVWSFPHFTDELTEAQSLSRVAAQAYLTLEPFCSLWQAQISGSIVWILLCGHREPL